MPVVPPLEEFPVLLGTQIHWPVFFVTKSVKSRVAMTRDCVSLRAQKVHYVPTAGASRTFCKPFITPVPGQTGNRTEFKSGCE